MKKLENRFKQLNLNRKAKNHQNKEENKNKLRKKKKKKMNKKTLPFRMLKTWSILRKRKILSF